MLQKKMKKEKGTTFKKLAQDVLKKRKIEVDGFINCSDSKIVYDALLSFLEQELTNKYQ